MKIRHTSGEQHTLPTLGLVTDENGVIDIDPALAGRDPDPRLQSCMDELRVAVDARDTEAEARLRTELDGLDRGEGLLAQDVWVPVKPKHLPKEDTK